MKTLNQKLVIVLLLAAMVSLTASVALAQPGHHHHPGGGWIPGYPTPWWLRPGPNPWRPIPYPRPIIVNPVSPVYTTYYESDATNPVPVANIQLANPRENRVTLRFTLNSGEVQSLAAGYNVQINQVSVIEFDRGNGAGRARYNLTDGAYKFVASGGMWDLVRQGADASPIANLAANPAPGN